MFIGDGGHAKSLKDCNIRLQLHQKVVGFVGLTCADLRRRLAQFKEYSEDEFPVVIHPSAHRSLACTVDAGSQILARAVVNWGADIGKFVVINTGAIIEHGAVVGAGSHIAPGAIVLGEARVGECCWIGAGAVVLQGATVPDDTFVKALTVHKGGGSNTAPSAKSL
jgi:UDP-3-O-[3-hydroxymyristoyl] glucosamine N-acyltransferase